MIAKYANRTCCNCGIRLPQPQMIKKELFVETGKSNTSITGSTFIGLMLGDKASQRAIDRFNFNSSARTYTRKQTKWFCKRCAYPDLFVTIKILSIPLYVYNFSKRLFKYLKSKN